MYHIKKGDQWRFGMKARIDANVKMDLTHSFTITSANVHYINKELINIECTKASIRAKVNHLFRGHYMPV
ncbi:MAG: hypothetical protein CMI05_07685 [Oceanospirillaceae bacterium]|nr:hypothetical protein [Oceanospirillaceae bacterium]|tara:strand:+ start:21845 stop:22054 length:210 start_codon:yes stop_codon:yes gene_type:complete